MFRAGSATIAPLLEPGLPDVLYPPIAVPGGCVQDWLEIVYPPGRVTAAGDYYLLANIHLLRGSGNVLRPERAARGAENDVGSGRRHDGLDCCVQRSGLRLAGLRGLPAESVVAVGTDCDGRIACGGGRGDRYGRVDQAVGRSGLTDDAIAGNAGAGDGQLRVGSKARAADGEWSYRARRSRLTE